MLQSLVPCEQTVGTHDGRWFSVRVMPYRTQSNVIDGLVITFVDTTAARKMEDRLREASRPPA